MGDRDSILANYMLSSIRKDLEFLKSNQYVNAQTCDEVLSLLPTQVENGSKRPPLPTRKSGTVSSPHLSPATATATATPAPKLPARRSATDNTTNTPPPKPSPRMTPPTPPQQQQQQQQRPIPAARSPSGAVQVMPSIPKQQQPPEPVARKMPIATPVAAAAAAAATTAAVVSDAQPEPTPPPAYTPTASSSIATAEAIYGYDGDDPSTDLSFRQGDIIQVTEYVNDDWWRGELNGKSGIFPQNHVKKISTPKPAAAKRAVPPKPNPAPVTPASTTTTTTNDALPPYSYPPPPTQMYPAPPASTPQQYYPPPPVAAAAGSSSSAMAPPGQPQQQGEHDEGGGKVHSMAKKFGGNVANAAVWGFGATVGSEAARAIF